MIKKYDIETDEFVEATQEDFDGEHEAYAKAMDRTKALIQIAQLNLVKDWETLTKVYDILGMDYLCKKI